MEKVGMTLACGAAAAGEKAVKSITKTRKIEPRYFMGASRMELTVHEPAFDPAYCTFSVDDPQWYC
jgi:hypothetical protein